MFFQLRGTDDPRQRLVVLIVALAVVVALLINLQRGLAPRPSPYPPPDAQKMIFADPELAGRDPFEGWGGDPQAAKHILDIVEKIEDQTWEATNLPAQQELLFYAFQALVSRSAADLAKEALSRSAWHYQKIMREPNRWRLLPMHVYGMLVHQETIEFPQAEPGMKKLFRLILMDPDELVFFTVLTPQIPAGTQIYEEGKRWGSSLAFDGLFLMIYPYRAQAGWKKTPLFVTRRVTLAQEGRTPPVLLDPRKDPGEFYEILSPRQTVAALDLDFLNDKIVDPCREGETIRGVDVNEMANDLRAEKAALFHVFEYVYGLSPEALARPNLEIDYVTLMGGPTTPEWARGQIAYFRGVAGSVDTLRFPPNPSGITRIHLVTAGDTRYVKFRKYLWVLAVLNLPEGLRYGDPIEATGVFVKRYPYKTEKRQWYLAPLIVCKEIRIVQPKPVPFWIYIVAGAIFLALLAAIAFVIRRDTAAFHALRKRSREVLGNRFAKPPAGLVPPRSKQEEQNEQEAKKEVANASLPEATAPPPLSPPLEAEKISPESKESTHSRADEDSIHSSS